MPDIRHLVFIRTNPEKIYAAISTQQGIASWWSTHNNAEPRVGSVYRISFGSDYYKDIMVSELVPGKKVVWDILHAHPEWLNTKVVFEINEEDGQSVLRFAHSGWQAYTDMFGQCSHHWGIYLQNLKIFCEKGQPMAMAEYF